MSFQSVHKMLAFAFLLCVGFDLMIADVLFPHCVGHIEVCADQHSTPAHQSLDEPATSATNQPEMDSGNYVRDDDAGCDHCCFGCCSHITSTTVFTFARPDVPPLAFATERVPLVSSVLQRLFRPPKSL